jgi:hypothetical protein
MTGDDEFNSFASASDSIVNDVVGNGVQAQPEPEPHFEPASFLPYPFGVYKRQRHQVLVEVLAGITVSFAQVPESVAFAFVAGVPPAAALHASWVSGCHIAHSMVTSLS